MTPWELQADELVTCNCAYGCPCQFNAAPTLGHCQAVGGFQIHRGHFGDIPLNDLKAAAVFRWPGAIHDGHGQAFIIIDQAANEAQLQALLTILSGGETSPGATVWNVFSATLEQVFDPAFAVIELTIDIDARIGNISVPDYIDSRCEPIRNPVTGAEHRVRIELPNGIEYQVAEMGSATSTTYGPIAMAFAHRYAQFAYIHLNNHGMVAA